MWGECKTFETGLNPGLQQQQQGSRQGLVDYMAAHVLRTSMELDGNLKELCLGLQQEPQQTAAVAASKHS
jgi:hypothetical protein